MRHKLGVRGIAGRQQRGTGGTRAAGGTRGRGAGRAPRRGISRGVLYPPDPNLGAVEVTPRLHVGADPLCSVALSALLADACNKNPLVSLFTRVPTLNFVFDRLATHWRKSTCVV